MCRTIACRYPAGGTAAEVDAANSSSAKGSSRADRSRKLRRINIWWELERRKDDDDVHVPLINCWDMDIRWRDTPAAAR